MSPYTFLTQRNSPIIRESVPMRKTNAEYGYRNWLLITLPSLQP